ncbi:MAG: type II secretion system protein [Patescibacteria group bacterium]
MRRNGYSLIELMVVIAIIGLLATLGTYAWVSSGKRSHDSIRKTDLSRIKNALQQLYLDQRSYPEFDNSQGNVFAASWQLDSNTACGHGLEKDSFLTPKYLSEIPQDPKRFTNYSRVSCGEIIDQHSHYLYLAGPRNSNSPRQFALMATLEVSINDHIAVSDNPLLTSIKPFEDYAVGVGAQPTFFDPNYIVKGNSGR